MPLKPIFEKKNVVVIGGAGFIGSHLCDELVKTSKVICVDNFISGSESNIDHLLQNPNFQFIRHDISSELDLENYEELDRFKVKFQGVQEIYNLACPTSPKDFEKLIIETALANSVGVKNSLDLALRYKARYVLASSAVVYGGRNYQHPYVKEDELGLVDQLSPRACYDEGKRYAETLVWTYRQAHQLDAKVARIFRTYGPRMALGHGHMLPDFVSNAIEGNDLVIYGDEHFSTSLCHVSDIIHGLVKLIRSGEAGPINLGSDLEIKISEVAEKVINLTNSPSKIVFEKPLLFMTPLALPDITAAKERLSWFPVTLLEQGIKGSIDYFKAHKSIVKPMTRPKDL